MLVEILFWVFASILAVSALAMIMVKNPVHAAMLLVLCFFTSASIWLLIEAELLAVVLILAYVRAVVVQLDELGCIHVGCLASFPVMVPADPSQQLVRLVGALPLASGVLVGF